MDSDQCVDFTLSSNNVQYDSLCNVIMQHIINIIDTEAIGVSRDFLGLWWLMVFMILCIVKVRKEFFFLIFLFKKWNAVLIHSAVLHLYMSFTFWVWNTSYSFSSDCERQYWRLIYNMQQLNLKSPTVFFSYYSDRLLCAVLNIIYCS